MALPATADLSTIAPALSAPDVLRSALEAALGVSRDGLMIIDAHGAVVAVNAAFPEVWGIDAPAGDPGDTNGEAVFGAALARVVDRESVLIRMRQGGEDAGTIELADGRVLACRAVPLGPGGQGRIWSFYESDDPGVPDPGIDPLTGAVAADHFPQAGSDVIRRAREDTEALSVTLIDIVNLVPIARANGAEVHDELLSGCASRWDGITRHHDLVGRVGEHRFAVLMPGARPKMTRVLAERLCQATHEVRIDRGLTRIRPKLVVGIACLRPDDDLGTLLRRAEESLAAAGGEGAIGPLDAGDAVGSAPAA